MQTSSNEEANTPFLLHLLPELVDDFSAMHSRQTKQKAYHVSSSGDAPRLGLRQGNDSIALDQWFSQRAKANLGHVQDLRHQILELQNYGAPLHYVRRARKALNEKVNRAHQLNTLSSRPLERKLRARKSGQCRALVDIAVNNAQAGCAEQSFGALIAILQTRRAKDKSLASFAEALAQDELRHSQLAWDLHYWYRSQLSHYSLQIVDNELNSALQVLSTSNSDHPFSATDHEELGLPREGERQKLATHFAEAIAPYALAS